MLDCSKPKGLSATAEHVRPMSQQIKPFIKHPSSKVRWTYQVVLVVKNPPANAGDARDAGSIPGSVRFPGGGDSLQYSCLANSVDRGTCWAIVHSVIKSQTQLKRLSKRVHVPKARW